MSKKRTDLMEVFASIKSVFKYYKRIKKLCVLQLIATVYNIVKKILIITFLLFSLKGFGQVFVNDWVTPVTFIPDEVSLLPNKIDTINADEN
jgi:hypothetical protein